MERQMILCSVFALSILLLHCDLYLPAKVLCQNSTSPPRPSYPCTIQDSQSYAFCNISLPYDIRVADLISRLTLQQKVAQLVNGAPEVPDLGLPAYEWWGEALHGVASSPSVLWDDGPVQGATSFPVPISLAASFNKTLWHAIGQAVSTEARAMHNLRQAGLTFWSPVINIVRDPRWGRVQETPGEDPLLVGQYAVHFVKGMQEGNSSQNLEDDFPLKTSACCKHYTAYDLDNWNGIERYVFDAEVTEQDLADTYNPPFRSCVEEGRASCLMCSYNKVNGVPTCGNPELLKEVVRKEWNLQGYIVTDCDSLLVMYDQSRYASSPVEAIATGLHSGVDLNCGVTTQQHGVSAVEHGAITERDIDVALTNTFTVLMRLGLFDGNARNQTYGHLGEKEVCSEEHQVLALEAAVQGVVLLKNDDGVLPLDASIIETLAVVGPNADDKKQTMLGNYEGRPCKYITPLQGLMNYTVKNVVMRWGCDDTACESDAKQQDAVTIAKDADAVILVMGLDQDHERETFDRNSLKLPGRQEELTSAVANASSGPVILVLMCAGPVDVSFAKDNPRIQSILWIGYPGQSGGQALAQILFGERQPVGRLPVTWYTESITDWPMTNMNMRPDESTGYPGRTHRFYTGATVYEFGYGLSYTKMSDLRITTPSQPKGSPILKAPSSHEQGCYHRRHVDADDGVRVCPPLNINACANATFPVIITAKNGGPKHLTETILVYHIPPRAGKMGLPLRQLIGFQQIALQAFETQNLHMTFELCSQASTVKEDGTRSIDAGIHRIFVSSTSGSTLEHSFRMK